MVENVERLGAELEANALADRKVLKYRHVPSLEPRTPDGVTRGIAGPYLTLRYVTETGSIKPLRQRMGGVGVRVASLIRTNRDVVGAEHTNAARISAESTVGDRNRQSAVEVRHSGNLPASHSLAEDILAGLHPRDGVAPVRDQNLGTVEGRQAAV